MNPEKFKELRDVTEEKILEVMRSPKPSAALIKQAELGLKYIKAVNSTELQKLSAVVQVAGLYSPANREEIAKKIIPPMYNIIDSDIEFIPGTELKALIESKNLIAQEKQTIQIEKQVLENKLADTIDEAHNKDKPKLAEIAQAEYQQKRDILK